MQLVPILERVVNENCLGPMGESERADAPNPFREDGFNVRLTVGIPERTV